MKLRAKPRVTVVFNRDFESASADPENKAREDIKDIAVHVVNVLQKHGYAAAAVGITDDVAAAVDAIKQSEPVVVFNLCESIRGDNRFESLLPMLLDLEGIAYTGSGSFSLALAMHKNKAKEVLVARGVPTPAAVVLTQPDVSAVTLPFPLIVKPSREDASVGISSASVVWDTAALAAQVQYVLQRYRQPVLVEQYIEGREIYVSLLGRAEGRPEVFPFFEIDFSDMPADRPRIVSFEGKWLETSAEYLGTRPGLCEGLSDEVRSRIAAAALAAFDALELRDYARVDVRLSADAVPYVIDVNPNCDLSAVAGGFSKAAKAGGQSYEDVVLRLVNLALSRRHNANTIPLPKRSKGALRPSRPEVSQSVPSGGGGLRARSPRGGAGSA